MEGAWYGTRQEADARADCWIVEADRSAHSEREDGGSRVKRSALLATVDCGPITDNSEVSSAGDNRPKRSST